MSRATYAALWVAVLAGFGCLAATNLLFGELNQDEGWYLYAARLVTEGKLPYRDFAFTQAPLLPFVYALAHPLVERVGLAGGRVFTILLGLLAALAASALARRLAPAPFRRHAALLAFGLAALNVYQSYFTTVVKTYALCGLLLAGGFLALALARDRRSVWLAALAGLLLAGSAATRITAGFALPAAGLFLLLARRALGDGPWLAFGAAGLAGLALLFGPLYLAAPEAFRFFVIDYHSARTAGGLAAALVFKAGFASRLLQAYFVVLVGLVVLLLFRALGIARGAAPREGLQVALWTTIAGITLVQVAAPFPYDDYQAPLFPVFCAALAVAVFRSLAADESRAPLATGIVIAGLLASAAAAVSSPINQNWMIQGRDRIWWRIREEPALVQLQKVAGRVRALAGGNEELLTQDVYLAVEAGLRVPAGLEMGPFSYYPDLTRERAAELHVVNRDMLREILATTPARAAALSGYSFVVAAPDVRKVADEEEQELWDLVRSRFRQEDEVPDFGQGGTTLRILVRDPGAAP